MRAAWYLALVIALVGCDRKTPHAEPVEAKREATPRDHVALLHTQLGMMKAFDLATAAALRTAEHDGTQAVRTPPEELLRDDTRKFTVFFGANNHGERNDCGCRRNPLGGLGRRHTMLKELTNPAGEIWKEQGVAIGPVFHVDAGDLLFKHNTLDQQIDRVKDVALYDAESVAAGLATMPIDAVLVGEHDVVLGLDVVTKLAKQHKLPFISANLKSNGELAFPPSVTVERDGLRVAFIGVTQPDSRRADYYAERNLTVDAPIEAYKAAATAVGEVDAVVLLSNLGMPQTRSLADELRKQGARVDLAVASSTNRLTTDPEFAGGVPVLEPNTQGKYLGRADVWLNGTEPARYANASVVSASDVRNYRRTVRSYWAARKQLGVEQLKIAEGELVIASLEASQQPDVGEAVDKLSEQREKDLKVLRDRLPTLENRLTVAAEALLQQVGQADGATSAGDDWIAATVLPVRLEYEGDAATLAVIDPREKGRPQ